MKDYAIEVNHVSMLFRLNRERVDNAKEYFIRLLTRKLHYTEFWALKDVSFKVEKGDRVGIMGFNGAGKSTLLKTIAGVLKPTMGNVKVSGTIAPMLELGAGFDPNYSGAENIYLYGATMGFSRKFIDEKYNEIVEFSELKDFINAPLKSYSSGMKSRLGFAIATAVKPDVLILDEVLSVGDGGFRQKSEAKMKSIINGGATTILVSHSIGQVRSMCNKVLWLDRGRQIAFGDDVQGICEEYESFLSTKKLLGE